MDQMMSLENSKMKFEQRTPFALQVGLYVII